MKTKHVFLILVISGIICSPGLHAQVLKGALNKVKKEALERVVGGESNDQPQQQGTMAEEPEQSGRPSQKSGGSKGLEKSTKDVAISLNEASDAFSKDNYKKTRFSLTEALGNLDLMIGDKILKSFPTQVEGLAADEENDQVASSSSNWAGLTIKREYKKDDEWLSFSVLNSSLAALANSAVNAGMYTYSNQPDQKTIEIAGNQAVINFDESTGYKITISMGQQTVIIIEGVNIPTEGDITKMANDFDYAFIKKMLGEN